MNNLKADINAMKIKVEILEKRIKDTEEIINWSKKENTKMLILGTITLGLIMYFTSNSSNLNVLEVFSISLMVCTIHNLVTTSMKTSRDDKFKLDLLEIDKSNYETLLKIKIEELEELENERS